MKEEDLRAKIGELNKCFSEELEKELEKIIKSGCVDFPKYGNDFILPKIIFSAILKSESFQFTPMSKEYQQEIKNVTKFL